MDLLIDTVNTIFIFVGIYFTVLLLLLFFTHEKKLFKKPTIKKFPSVSVIIPAHNEEKDIGETIKSVKKMKYPHSKEIIVVDDGSTDKTYDVAKKFKDVKVLRKRQGGKASALNFGLKSAKGEIVACIDSDSYPEENALLKTVPFFEKNVAAVTTSVLVKNTKGILERLQGIEYAMVAWSRKLFEFMNAVYATPGPMSLYKRDVLKKVGGFDEKNLTEDIEIAWRLIKNKYDIKMSLDTKVYTNVPKEVKKWWHQRVRWNIGGIQTTLKYFKLFTKKEFGSVGTFLLPLFSLSYVLSFIGILFMFYSLFTGLRYLIGSYLFGFNPIGTFLLYFSPDIFIALFIINFILLILYIRANFKTIKSFTDFPSRLRDLLLYIFVYTCVFPFNLIDSTIKFLTKRYKW
jgi:cellulose synthase/poly-beta-1,6-N-acetylglucosamine synthase-like glycosyltransferase